MAKVNVSLPDELLGEVDELAAELHRSRSGLVREATARYVAEVRAERQARERRERIGKAMERAREIAECVPPDMDGTEIIRHERDAPPRWLRGEDRR